MSPKLIDYEKLLSVKPLYTKPLYTESQFEPGTIVRLNFDSSYTISGPQGEVTLSNVFRTQDEIYDAIIIAIAIVSDTETWHGIRRK